MPYSSFMQIFLDWVIKVTFLLSWYRVVLLFYRWASLNLKSDKWLLDSENCLTAKCETNNRDLHFKPRCDRDSFGVPRLLSFPFLYLPNVEQITGISVWNEDLSYEDSLPHSEMDHWEWIDWLYYEGQNTPPGLSRLIVSLMMKEKLLSKMKHSRNCERCPGH